jgi:hypothetical protein
MIDYRQLAGKIAKTATGHAGLPAAVQQQPVPGSNLQPTAPVAPAQLAIPSAVPSNGIVEARKQLAVSKQLDAPQPGQQTVQPRFGTPAKYAPGETWTNSNNAVSKAVSNVLAPGSWKPASRFGSDTPERTALAKQAAAKAALAAKGAK